MGTDEFRGQRPSNPLKPAASEARARNPEAAPGSEHADWLTGVHEWQATELISRMASSATLTLSDGGRPREEEA